MNADRLARVVDRRLRILRHVLTATEAPDEVWAEVDALESDVAALVRELARRR